jgi:hypothetical protein
LIPASRIIVGTTRSLDTHLIDNKEKEEEKEEMENADVDDDPIDNLFQSPWQ